MKLKVISSTIILFWILTSCSSSETFECPCGGEGIVSKGTIITIEERNSGDTDKILNAIESKLGGECCYFGED